MRRTGWIFLASILLLSGAVGWIYRQQREAQASNAPAKPASLAENISASSADWHWSKTEGDKVLVEVKARQFEQKVNPPRVDLQHVELKIFHKEGAQYDLVRSARAELRMEESTLYSDGEVEITMGLAADQTKSNRLVTIKTSGVTFDTQSGKASTERAASFVFENSEGSATGAVYDPATRELQMRNNVKLLWRGAKPEAKPMEVEAGELAYREAESKVYLKPWSRLKRDTLTLNAAASVVTLEEGEIRLVEAEKANGDDRQPKRQLQYAAGRLFLHFGAKGVMEKITGQEEAHLETKSDSGRTVVNSARMDMNFETVGGDSLLRKALAMGHTVVESYPTVRNPADAPSDRVLKSDTVELAMRPNGEEIESVVTHAPGQIEFLPHSPRQVYRRLDGERFWMTYGAANQLEKFRAAQVATVTRARKKGDPDRKTWSRDMEAYFDPKTGEMRQLEQWTNFRYEEGPRQARSERARLDQPTEKILLTGAARIWDPSGSTDAARIELDQKTGNMIAEGNVASTRLPDEKKPQKKALTGSLLDASETIQAKADRMETRDENRWIRYDGKALLWQGPNRIDADTIVIQRKEQRLDATGHVVSQFREKNRNLFTVVKAPEMTYWDADKKAWYRGNIQLDRGDLNVTSRELYAWFSKKENDNSLERAQALGNAVIVQTARDRTRRGLAEQADYAVPEGVVVLTGGAPQMFDSVKGNTRGQKLTWYADSDRLVVDGASAAPAVSRILKKGKQAAPAARP